MLFQEDAGVDSDEVLRELIEAVNEQLEADDINVDITPQQAKGESKIVLFSLPRVVLVTVITLVFSC